MKPAAFEYHAPESVADAAALLGEHGDEAKPLAGGQSLVPMLALRLTRFEHLVDLNRVRELRSIEREEWSLRIGAMVTQRTVERDAAIGAASPLLTRATPLIGHFQIRNRGTIGGSLAHADPASEYPAVAIALGAEVEVARDGAIRRIPARDLFVTTWTTCLDADDLLVAVHVPVWTGRCGFAIDEVARRLGDFALAGVACAVAIDDDGVVTRAGIGLLGMGSTPIRASDAEDALVGADPNAADLDDLGRLAIDDAEPLDDVHATSAYRRTVGARLVSRALGRALEEARHG